MSFEWKNIKYFFAKSEGTLLKVVKHELINCSVSLKKFYLKQPISLNSKFPTLQEHLLLVVSIKVCSTNSDVSLRPNIKQVRLLSTSIAFKSQFNKRHLKLQTWYTIKLFWNKMRCNAFSLLFFYYETDFQCWISTLV